MEETGKYWVGGIYLDGLGLGRLQSKGSSLLSLPLLCQYYNFIMDYTKYGIAVRPYLELQRLHQRFQVECYSL